MNRIWLFGSVPLALVGLVLLCVLITKLVQTMRAAELARVPLAETATLEFSEPGNVDMHLEGPRFTQTFVRLRYTLTDTESGNATQLSPSMVSMRSSGIDTARVLHGTFYVAHPGRYTLRVSGLGESADAARCRLIFARPYTLIVVLCILGIVFSAIAFIGGTIFSLILGIKTN